MEINKIYQGDSLEVLKTLPDNSINMCMTSPPYWALRDYGVDGQLGLESTFQEYINKLCDIFDEVKRVLRDDGTCWVNLSDTYFGSGAGTQKNIPEENNSHENNIQSKSLCLIPQRFAIEMVNRGWILRNTIIWHKKNCMPSSAKDRFTVDFEYIYFFSKSKKYFFNQQLEKTITKDNIIRDRDTTKLNNTPGRTRMGGLNKNNYDFKNKRAVWTINPKPFSEAHFAVYPEELCETPIKAGCPEFVCKKCSKAREKIVESLGNIDYSNDSDYKRQIDIKHNLVKFNRNSHKMETTQKVYKGISDCGCNVGFESGTVLDPFFGAGTTGVVAKKQGKNYIGIELNPEYIEIAKKRLNKIPRSLKTYEQ